jgi:hypothetical protein
MASNKTIVDIINNVLEQSGFLRRPQIFNSADPDDRQMAAIANRTNIEIAQFYKWSAIRKVFEIILVENQNTYALPTDLNWVVPDSSWEEDGSRKVDDYVSDAVWYQFKFSSLTTGGTIRARIYGDTIEVIDPFAGGKIIMEYMTDQAVEDSLQSGLLKEEFTKDTDYFLLGDQLLTLGIQAHWALTKLLPQADAWGQNYMKKMNEAVGRDGTRNTIGGSPQQTRRAPYTKLWVN